MQYGIIDIAHPKSLNSCNLNGSGSFPIVFKWKKPRGVLMTFVLRGCPWLFVPLLVLETETVKLEKAGILEHSLADVLVKLSVLRLTVVSHGWCFCWFFFQKIRQSLLDKTVVGMRKRFHRWLMRMSQTQDLNLVLLFPQAILSSSRSHYHQDFRGSR